MISNELHKRSIIYYIGSFNVSNYFSLKDVAPLTFKANVIYCFKVSGDKTQSYIGKAQRHLAIRVEEHFSEKSEKSAIHEHISSCKDCHSFSILNFFTLAQADTDFEAKIREALYIYKYTPKLNNQIYHCDS